MKHPHELFVNYKSKINKFTVKKSSRSPKQRD